MVRAALTFVDAQGISHEGVSINDAMGHDFVGYRSVRQIPAYRGQGHLPGFYWFSTINQLVPYESRLEMFTLMALDFEGEVIGVLGQPLHFDFERNSSKFGHVPDFLVWRERTEPTIVDVKPEAFLDKGKNRQVFECTELVCRRLGWQFELRSEPDDVYLANLKWLAGFRRRPPQFRSQAEQLFAICGERSIAIRDVLTETKMPAFSRPVLFHLIWKGLVSVDTTTLLSDDSLVSFQLNGRSV